MRRHWQKRPLLIRAAVPDAAPLLPRAALFALAADEAVESRLVVRDGARNASGWSLRRGPVPRRALPPLSQPGWTLLVQGLDHHVAAAHDLLMRFRFVPDARLDDLMVSWASDGGGVGPHVDSYDVFLLQLEGRRRWRVSPPGNTAFVDGLPLKILAHFEPQHEWLLEPGDMLYLPPGWGHDGVAEGACTTASIGFRAPARDELAREVLGRLVERADDAEPVLYRDPSQPATASPARVPAALQRFAADAVARALREPLAAEAALGEALTEPKPGVWFASEGGALDAGVRLDARSRMLYDDHHVFCNGESWRASGRDARLMQQLADRRMLDAATLRRASASARGLLLQWLDDGWLLSLTETPDRSGADGPAG